MAAKTAVGARLSAALAALGREPRGEWRYEPLAGGSSDRSYRVESREGQWVVKLRSAARGPQLDVEAEARVTAAAAAAGLAPRVVAHDARAGTLVTEYWPGARSWTLRDVRGRAGIERLAAVLRRLHSLPADLSPYALAAVADDYVRVAGTPTACAARYATELAERARRFEARHAPSAFCHNDLVASNVLDDGERLGLIDFEYAVRAAPILALAGVAAMNRYSRGARTRLVEAYYDGAPPVSFDAEELDGVVRTLRLLAWFWAAANARTAAAPGVYEGLLRQLGDWLEAE